MLLALGAASSAIDALQALTSSKSSSGKTTGVSQQGSPFDFFSSSAASTGQGGGAVVNGIDILAARQPRQCAAGPVLPDRCRWRRQDHQTGIRKGARRWWQQSGA